MIEDCGEAHEAVIRAQFGVDVARIVCACTDGTAEGKFAFSTPEERKADWLRRKQKYLAHLADEDDQVLLVSACDKLHNALAIVRDLEDPTVGARVFERFTGGREGTLWYYAALRDVFLRRESACAGALATAVARLYNLAEA